MTISVCQLCAVDFTLHRFLLPLIDGMLSAGFDVTTVCSDGPSVAGLRGRGYKVTTVPIARTMNPTSGVRSIVALIKLFRLERFDIVHVHTPIAALLGRIAAKIAGVPIVIYTAHGFYFHDEMPTLKRRFHIGLEWLGGRFTDFLFTQSEEDAESAVFHRFMKAEKILAIGNGIDMTQFDPTQHEQRTSRMALGIPSDALVVGIIGRLVQEKGYVEFLRSAEMIGRLNKSTYFLVVGQRLPSDHDAPIDRELARAQQALGTRLILAGMREDVPTMLAAMDIFCLPSYREGMPRTIIEAMMMGKPVVATNIRGAREEVVEGLTGFLVPTRDTAALARALLALLENPDKARSMGQEGRSRALALYDERQIVAVQVQKILEIAAGRTGMSI